MFASSAFAFTDGLARSRIRCAVVAFAAAILLAACGGGGGGGDGGGGGGGATTTPMTGTLSTPGGALAFNAPTGLRRFFAELFGRNAFAALPGMSPVVGASIKLIEIDSSGNQAAGTADIATAVTAADGSFTLNVPSTLVPGPRYAIRASGTSTSLDRLVTGSTSQDVDPATQATKSLVITQVAGGSLLSLQRSQLEELENDVAALVNVVAPAVLANTANLVDALIAAAQNDEGLANAIGNLTQAQGISGTITDAGGPVAGVKVSVLDFNQWVVRAQAVTDASGQYSLNVAPGDYIVGALNFTASSTGASEWWTCNDLVGGPTCGSANQFDAAKVTVGAATTTVNFKLEPGARVEGAITSAASPSAGLPGIQVGVRDFTNDTPVVFRHAQTGGAFRVNVRPGTYAIATRNKTPSLAYAGGVYNGPAAGGDAVNGGGTIVADATPMVLAAGNTYTVNFPLIEGGLVGGLITDGAPTPNNKVTGITVRFNLLPANPADTTGAFVEALRTDNTGNYGLWVRPGKYAVRARGQIATPTVVAFSANNNPPAVNFAAVVGRATATLHGPTGAPLSQMKVSVYDTTASNLFQGHEVSNGDGTVEVFAQPTGSYRLEYKLDNGSTTTGSAIHDGTATPAGKQLLAGASVAFDTAAGTPTTLGILTLPAGGELKGVITLGGAAGKNIIVQIRSGGVTGAQRFIATRTSSDGSYSLSLPAATYNRVCAFVPGTLNQCPVGTPASAGAFGSADMVTVTANQSTTLNIAIP